jgi:hypothetical protein
MLLSLEADNEGDERLQPASKPTFLDYEQAYDRADRNILVWENEHFFSNSDTDGNIKYVFLANKVVCLQSD